jgi:hypothetical protein
LLNSNQPVVDGVLMEVILAAANDGSGYVKCLVPSSDKTPHRAMLADREYFKRTTEGFYRLEHFDLEDMFGRRPRPNLEVSPSLRRRDQDPATEEVQFFLVNRGRGVAKYSGFLIRMSPEVKVVGVTGSVEDVSKLNDGAPVVSYQDNTSVFHPNNIRYNVGGVIVKREALGQPLAMRVSWYCENMVPRTEILNVHSE